MYLKQFGNIKDCFGSERPSKSDDKRTEHQISFAIHTSPGREGELDRS